MTRQVLEKAAPVGVRAEQEHREQFRQTHLQNQTRVPADDVIQVVAGDDLQVTAVRDRSDRVVPHVNLCRVQLRQGFGRDEGDEQNVKEDVRQNRDRQQNESPLEQRAVRLL